MKLDEIAISVKDAKREGLMEGLAEGEQKKARETDTKMLEDGISINTINKYTGLSIQEIEELRKQGNN